MELAADHGGPRGGAERRDIPIGLYVPGVAAFALTYYAISTLSTQAAAISGGIAVMWPTSAFAFAVLLAWGRRFWPGIVLGDLGFSISLGMAPGPGEAVTLLALAATNTLTPMLGVSVLKTLRHPLVLLDGLPATLRLLGVYIGMALLASGSALLVLGLISEPTLPRADWPATLWQWWRAAFAGYVVLATPAVLLWRRRRIPWHWPNTPESMGILLLTVLLAAFQYGADPGLGAATGYLPLLACIWAGLRLGPSVAALTLWVVLGLTLLTTLEGLGPFPVPSGPVAVEQLQAFTIAAGLAMTMALAIHRGWELRVSRARSVVDAAREKEAAMRQSLQKRDVDLRQAKTAVERTRADVDAELARRSSFLHALGRNMRVPAGYLIEHVAREAAGRPATGDQIATAAEAARALDTMGDNLVDFAALQAKSLAMARGPVVLDNLVEDLAELLATDVAPRGAVVMSFVDPRLPRAIQGDAARIAKVLLSLAEVPLGTPGLETLTLIARPAADNPEADSLEFMLVDQSPGLSEKDRRQLFTLERFASAARTDGQQPETAARLRSGFSLWVARQLLEAMGGGVAVSSEPGVGTSIIATLGIETAPIAQDAEGPIGEAVAGLHVLVILESPPELEIIGRYLDLVGTRVTALPSEADLLGALVGGTYDTVVIEAPLLLRPASPDGRTLAAHLRAQPPAGVGALVLVEPRHDDGSLDKILSLPGLAGLPTTVLHRPMRRAAMFDAVHWAAGRGGVRVPQTRLAAESARPAADDQDLETWRTEDVLAAADNWMLGLGRAIEDRDDSGVRACARRLGRVADQLASARLAELSARIIKQGDPRNGASGADWVGLEDSLDALAITLVRLRSGRH